MEFLTVLPGVMLAVETIVENLKKMSKPVTTPEEIAQVRQLVELSKLHEKRSNNYILISSRHLIVRIIIFLPLF